MVVDRFTFKTKEITLSPCFDLIPKTGVGLPKSGVSFYCVFHSKFESARFFESVQIHSISVNIEPLIFFSATLTEIQ